MCKVVQPVLAAGSAPGCAETVVCREEALQHFMKALLKVSTIETHDRPRTGKYSDFVPKHSITETTRWTDQSPTGIPLAEGSLKTSINRPTVCAGQQTATLVFATVKAVGWKRYDPMGHLLSQH